MLNFEAVRIDFLNRMAQDPTFQTITGANGTDERLYERYNADAVLSVTQPCYVTYMLLPHGETRQGVQQPVFSLIIWGKTEASQAIADLRTRIFELYDQQIWTAGGARVQSRFIRESDTDEPQVNIIGRMIQIRVGYTHKAPAQPIPLSPSPASLTLTGRTPTKT